MSLVSKVSYTALTLGTLLLGGCSGVVAHKPGSTEFANALNLREAGDTAGSITALRHAIASAASERMRNRAGIALAQALLRGDPGPEARAEARQLLTSAAADDPVGQRQLARAILDGAFGSPDVDAAATLMRRAAPEDPAAAIALADMIDAGSATPDNDQEKDADAWRAHGIAALSRSAEDGSSAAARQLGALYADPNSNLYDPIEADRLYRLAISRGERGAILPLAELWLATDQPQDVQRAEALLRRGVEAGEPEFALNLARQRADAGDLDDAVRFYAVAAEAGYNPAYLGLAGLLLDTRRTVSPTAASTGIAMLATGVDKDPEVAVALGRLQQTGRYGQADPTAAARLFRTAANRGSDVGALYYGLALKQGAGVLRDKVAAAGYLKRAADSGESRAWIDLAELYSEGPASVADPAQARKYYRLAADRDGSVRAARGLAALLRSGKGGPRDLSGALKWTLVAARAGSVGAMQDAGAAYAVGEGTPVNLAEASRWFVSAARKGSASGALRAGWAYAAGRGVATNRPAANRLFEISVRQKPSLAASIGKSFALGLDGVRDQRAALQWLRRAGRTTAAKQYAAIARAYEVGKRVPQNADAALTWHRRAAEAGNARAALWLAKAASSGRYPGIGPEEAAQWYRQSALGGAYEEAERQARNLTVGIDGPPDPAKALDWWLVAARGGSAEAKFRVGMAYLNGMGTQTDRKKAASWLRDAEKSGFPVRADSLLGTL